jgi:hypothetical protein
MSLSRPVTDLVAIAAGAALLVVGTGGAAAAPGVTAAAYADRAATVARVPHAADGGEDLRVAVPELLLGAPTSVAAHEVRLPVLVATSPARGTARVPGAVDGCSVPVVAGEVAWLRCTIAPGDGPPSVRVDLDDGRVLVRSAPAGR